MQRVVLFIDGEGLYFSLRHEFQKTRVSLGALISKLVGNRELVRAYYYSVQLSEPQKRAAQQQRFFEALMYIPHVEVRLGRLIQRGGQYYVKGTDVAMATDLLGLLATYDIAILVTGDVDFLPAVQAVKDRGKVVEVAFPRSGFSERLAAVSDVYIPMDEDFMEECWQTTQSQSRVIEREMQKTLEFYKSRALPSQQNVLEILENIGVINRRFQALTERDNAIIHVLPQIAAGMSGACLDRTAFQNYVGLACILLEFDIEGLRQVTNKYEREWKGLRLLEQFLSEQGLVSGGVHRSLNYLRKVIALRNVMPPYHRPSAEVVTLMAELGLFAQPSSAEEWQSNWDQITGGVLNSFRAVRDALEPRKQ